MGNDLRSQIFNNLNLKETEELLDIWTSNDHVAWSDMTFDVIKELLEQRLEEIPPQDEPIFEYTQQENNGMDEESETIDRYSSPENSPVFYKPKQVLWLYRWLNRLAVLAVGIVIIVNIPEIILMRHNVLADFAGNPQGDLLSWLYALVIGGLVLALQCALYYFSLRALASILKILMEMEFNSRTKAGS